MDVMRLLSLSLPHRLGSSLTTQAPPLINHHKVRVGTSTVIFNPSLHDSSRVFILPERASRAFLRQERSLDRRTGSNWCTMPVRYGTVLASPIQPHRVQGLLPYKTVSCRPLYHMSSNLNAACLATRPLSAHCGIITRLVPKVESPAILNLHTAVERPLRLATIGYPLPRVLALTPNVTAAQVKPLSPEATATDKEWQQVTSPSTAEVSEGFCLVHHAPAATVLGLLEHDVVKEDKVLPLASMGGDGADDETDVEGWHDVSPTFTESSEDAEYVLL